MVPKWKMHGKIKQSHNTQKVILNLLLIRRRKKTNLGNLVRSFFGKKVNQGNNINNFSKEDKENRNRCTMNACTNRSNGHQHIIVEISK